jgi:hypothetical protein
MIWDRHHCNLLVRLFGDKWKSVRYDHLRWRNYLFENGILPMGLDTAASLWNQFNGECVCIENPTEEEIVRKPTRIAEVVAFSKMFNGETLKSHVWLLVPKEFAEKALKQRSLPDFP